ncbi:hypothetical protein [Streptomyces sp. NPDC094031]|uniref:hypothetical protein n=1 Tax=Streptomyces sp. NPDC094031 TaxID=3155307 RepID=UPI003316BD5B
MPRPSTKHAEAAAKAVFDRYVADGHMKQHEADAALRGGLPDILAALAAQRIVGVPEEETTALLQAKVTADRLLLAEARGRRARRHARLGLMGAEVALAAWDGIRRDLGEVLATVTSR